MIRRPPTLADRMRGAPRTVAGVVVAVCAIPQIATTAADPGQTPQPSIVWSTENRPGPGPKGAAVLRDGTIVCARTEGTATGVRVVVAASTDAGRTWTDRGDAVTAERGADIGDGCLLQLRDGSVLYSYRDNRTEGPEPRYSIRVAESRDAGRTWRPHSTVTECSGARGGLWSSFLLQTRSGALQCYYDDERTPWDAGFARHQWLTMQTWDARAKRWVRPVTVSRADNPALLSRDGMGSVVELSRGKLLCVIETVDTAPPHAGVVMCVTSEDGGKTWSWARRERGLAYQAADRRFGAYCPWIARARNGSIVCVFGLNEGREKPIPGGTPLPDLRMDIACVESDDGGRTWSRPVTRIYEGTHRSAMPGIVALPRAGELLVHWLDFDQGYLSTTGRAVR